MRPQALPVTSPVPRHDTASFEASWLLIDADNLRPGPWLHSLERPTWMNFGRTQRVLIAADRAHKIDAWLDALAAPLAAPCLVVTREVQCAADAADRAMLATLKTWLRAGARAEQVICLSGDRKLVYQLHGMTLAAEVSRMCVCASWAMKHVSDDLGVEFWQAPVHARKPTAVEQVSGYAPVPKTPGRGNPVRPTRPARAQPSRRMCRRVAQAAQAVGADHKWVGGAALCERFVLEGILARNARAKMGQIQELAPGVLLQRPGEDLWRLA